MSEFIKQPIYIDKTRVQDLINENEILRQYYQEYIDRYEALGMDKPVLKNELAKFFETPKKFIAEKILQGSDFNLGGLALDAQKAFDIVSVPAGCRELFAELESHILNREIRYENFQVTFFHRRTDFFTLDGYSVVDNPEYIDRITEQCTIYLTTKKQSDSYAILLEIAEKFNALEKLHTGISSRMSEEFFNDYFKVSNGCTTVKFEKLQRLS